MKKSILFFGLPLLILLASCVQPIYYPNKIHVPTLKENEFYANIGGSGNSGWNGAFAYSPINSFFLEAGGNFVPGFKAFESGYATRFFYGSIGTYSWLSPGSFLQFEAGYGRGASETYDLPSVFIYDDSLSHKGHSVTEFNHTDAAYNRLHVQGSVAFHANLPGDSIEDPWRTLLLEGSLSGRFSWLHTTKYNIDHFDSSKTYVSSDAKSYSNSFFEYAATVRFGVRHLMLELQYGFSNIIGPSSKIPYDPLIIGVSLVSYF